MGFLDFLKWYYYETPRSLLKIWENFIIFPFYFFGIHYHLTTLFRPWHLIVVQFEEETGAKRFFLNLASRIIGRIMGMFVRLFTILAGLISIIAAFFIGLALQLFWLSFPVVLASFFIQGIAYLL